MALQDIYKKASLVMKPAAMKEGKLYSQQPHSGDGDFTFSRANGTQTRINKHGLIETVADNTPRLSYELDSNGNVSECPHLLLEPSRSNLLSHSSDFSNWSDSGVTVTSNDILAPDGTQSADKLFSSSNNWRKSKSFSASSGATYTCSVFAKLDTTTTTTTAQVEIYKGASGFSVDFNLSNKTISGSGLTDAFIEEYPNDWYRIGGTYTANGTNNIIYVYPSAGYSTSGTMYFWGAQVEAGSHPTSYIPTEGSAAQRAQDACRINSGIDSILNTNEGTLFFDLEAFEDNGLMRISLSDQTSGTDYIMLDLNNGSLRPTVRSNSGYYNPSLTTLSTNTRIKLAFTYSSNEIRMTYDGNTVSTSSITYIPTTTLESFKFSLYTGDTQVWKGKIHQAIYFNTALSDSELEELTS